MCNGSQNVCELMKARPAILRPRRSTVILAAILTLHGCLLFWQAIGDSAAWDEVGHFVAGLDIWQNGDFDMYKVNPPLIRAVALLPVSVCIRKTDYDHNAVWSLKGSSLRPEFIAGARMAQSLGRAFFRWLDLARCSCIIISIVTAWVCYKWANDLWQPPSGYLAAALWCFSPTVLGYGHLITPDVGAACAAVVAAFFLRRWIKNPTFVSAVFVGGTLGVAELTKFTNVLLWPIWFLLAITLGKQKTTSRTHRSMANAAHAFIFLLVSLFTLNLGYGFQGSFERLGDYRFVSKMFGGPESNGAVQGPAPRNRFSKTFLANAPMPFPASYIEGIDIQRVDFENHLWSFLNGNWRLGGWWYYYLYAMLLKEPLGVWVLAFTVLGAMFAFPRVYLSSISEELILLIPLISIISFVSSQTGFNHHLRYILPAYPFAFISLARAGRAFGAGHFKLCAITSLALIWSFASSLAVCPHSLCYFNELAGGPRNGHNYLGNSNADWGQDLLYLKAWANKHPEATPLHVLYDMPLLSPSEVDIRWVSVPPGRSWVDSEKIDSAQLGPQVGWFAVSVNGLHDREHRYDYFNELSPVGWVGYTMPIYHITLDQANIIRRKDRLPELSVRTAKQGSKNTR